MTTHYVRDESGFREARPNDVLERAQALLSQRYRVGSPVLICPALTRAQRSCGQDGRARKGDLKTLTPTSLATSHLGRKRLFMKPIDPLRAHSQENFAAGVSTAREPALLQQASLPLRGAELALEEKHALVKELAVKHGPAAAAFPAVAGSQRGRYPGCDSRGISASAAGAEPRNDPSGRGLHLHLVYTLRPDDPARHPPAAP